MSEVAQPAPELEPTPPAEPRTPTVASAPKAPWLLADRWWGALGMVGFGTFAFYMGQVVPTIVIGVWIIFARNNGQVPSQEALEADLIPYFSIITLGSIVAVALLFGLLVLVKQLPAPPSTRSSGLKSAGWALATFVVVMAGVHGLSWFQTWLGYPVEEQEIVAKAFKDSTGAGYASIVAAVVVLAPLGEELFFRRFVLMTLRAGCGVVVANLLTAWLFALIHMNPPAFLIYCWLGLGTAFAYQRTGRLWVPIAVHAANNLTAVLANAS
jgi:membrane protease YdiL (CAAX protease family)